MASIKASSRTKEGKYEVGGGWGRGTALWHHALRCILRLPIDDPLQRHMSRFHLSMAFDRVSIARSELKALQRLAGRK